LSRFAYRLQTAYANLGENAFHVHPRHALCNVIKSVNQCYTPYLSHILGSIEAKLNKMNENQQKLQIPTFMLFFAERRALFRFNRSLGSDSKFKCLGLEIFQVSLIGSVSKAKSLFSGLKKVSTTSLMDGGGPH
jgi:hypothetical protein